jgi:hypothetical protein
MDGISYGGPALSVASENPLAERVRELEAALMGIKVSCQDYLKHDPDVPILWHLRLTELETIAVEALQGCK